ncbi:MAG: T9SS type A sorting domain-containing protein [Bacteroidales bacterium]|nr:T9SS type A sorting domain-containing protein [Bacteroidales bacterium]
MKIYIIIFILYLFVIKISGQTIEYSYDATGNRILRQIITLQSNNVDSLLSEHYFNDKKDTSNKSVHDYAGEYKINIFPNPVNANLHIIIENYTDKTNISYTLNDNNGKQIKHEVVYSKIFNIDFLNFPDGNYILNLYINNEKKEYKIIKI